MKDFHYPFPTISSMLHKHDILHSDLSSIKRGVKALFDFIDKSSYNGLLD